LIFPGEEQSREASVGGISPRKIPRRDYRFYYPALNHERNIRNFKIIDSLNTAILSFSTFDDFGGVSLDHFIDRSFEKIIESGVTSLIIDLRGNTGGPPDPSLNLLSHLVEEPFTYFWKPSRPFSKYNYLTYPHSDLFTGDLYVLINGGCFSTTGHFLSHLSYFKRGILIGEESGGSFSCNDNSEEHNLSNTGIYLRYARTSFVTYKDAFERGRGIFPDVEVIPTIVDILNERDVVMEEALKMIGGKLKN
jgi:C-terminal processing protease CtpA/Prc